MRTLWWQIPGPAQFVGKIVQDLQDGKNVVIGVPEHFPPNLASAVRAQIEASEAERWYTIHADDDPDVAPLSLLYSLILGREAPGYCSTATLANEDAFAGWVIWVSGLTTETWPCWRSFIESYTHSCRSCSLAQRTVFSLVLQGTIAEEPPADDVCLVVHQWQDVVTRFDMLLYTASRMPTTQLRSALHHQLTIACIANLAQWDPFVTDALIYEPLKTILAPHSVLVELARQRGWHPTPGAAAWHTGRIASMYGQVMLHSASAALEGDQERLIEKRIWSAQVGTLFPFVEEQRQELLSRLRRHLTVPYETLDGGVISDPQNLEIGHIFAQLSELRRKGWRETSLHLESVIKRANTLRQIRNDLAHLKCVSAELINQL